MPPWTDENEKSILKAPDSFRVKMVDSHMQIRIPITIVFVHASALYGQSLISRPGLQDVGGIKQTNHEFRIA